MRFIRVHEGDNVAVALQDTPSGTAIALINETLAIHTQSEIPANHKVALTDIATDEPILKHGVVIGYATQSITAGEHVHTQNTIGVQDYQIQRGEITT